MANTSAPETVRAPLLAIDRFFKISSRGSTISREIRGGLVTFFAMSYIIVLNPLIIGTIADGTGQFIGGDPATAVSKVAATTALIAGLTTIAMGLFANFPIALATGLGLNAVVAFSIAMLPNMTWQAAMGIVVWEGIIILVLVLSGFRLAVFRSVPKEIKTAISVGIGLFIALVGLFDAGIVRIPASLATPVSFGINGSLQGWPMAIFVIGLMLAIVLLARKVRGAILISIITSTVLAVVVEAVTKIGPQGANGANPTGWKLNSPDIPGSILAPPDFSLLGRVDMFGAFAKIGIVSTALLVFALLLADFFDTMGTMVAIGAEADLLDKEGNPPKAQQILIVDSVAAIAGGAGSVSSNTSYIESAAGVGDGARTGLASIVTGVAFLFATFLSPLVALVPYEAATPALVVVGFLMMTQVSGIDWHKLEVAIPAFLTIILMPFTYSITTGIGAGFISFVVLKVFMGKFRQVHPLMWITSALFVLYFTLGPIQAALAGA